MLAAVALCRPPAAVAQSGVPPAVLPRTVSLTPEETRFLREHPTITVFADPDWPPAEYLDESGRPVGIAVDYLRLVEQRVGAHFEFVRGLTWQEYMRRARRHEIDLATCVSATAERQRFWLFTRPYLRAPVVIVTRADVTYVANLRELAGRRVAVVDSYPHHEWIRQDFPQLQLVPVPNVEAGLALLASGKVLALVENMLCVNYYLAGHSFPGLKISGQTPYENAQCMAVRNDWPVLATILQKGLDSITEEERLRIYQTWVPLQHRPGPDRRLLWQLAGAFALVVLALLARNLSLRRALAARRRAEENLRNTSDELQMILQNMLNAFVIWESVFDDEGNYVSFRFGYFNDAYTRVSGVTQEQVRGKDVFEVWPETEHSWLEVYGQVATTGVARSFDMEHKPTNGWYHCIAYRPTESRDRICVIFEEITEARKAQAERERLMAAIEQAGETVLITDPNGLVQYANPAYERVTGRTREEILGQPARLLRTDGQDEALEQQIAQTLAAGRTWQGRLVSERKDGRRYTAEATISPVFDDAGAMVNCVVVSRDITEHLRLAADLQQAQKMEAIGLLAGGVAHDFNNMLTIILGQANIGMLRTERAHPLRDSFEQIAAAAQRAAELIRQLLAFARKQTIAPQVLDLNAAVEGMLAMLRRLIGESIELSWRGQPDLWPVYMDPSQVDQIIANLCVNARDAIADVGHIAVESSNVTCDDAYCADRPDHAPGDYVLLAVTDDGHGMDRATAERIFEPFFTTKEEGQGTGLGLSTVYGIARQNGGFVTVYSEPGHGATFRVYLPRYLGAAATAAAPDAAPALGGGETILVVEDETAILDLVTAVLADLGYRVLAADGPAAALRTAAEYPDPIDLLLTDAIMPEMNGRELAQRLLQARPALRCLFMSGYAANAIGLRGVLEEGVHFLPKPFDVQELAARVREALG